MNLNLHLRKFYQNGESYDKLKLKIEKEKANCRDYNDYLIWLSKQDKTKAINYWKNFLEGYDSDGKISAMKKPEQTDVQVCEIFGKISTEKTDKLKRIAEASESTINTVAETAVGIMLQKYSRGNDEVFGKEVSGRNAHIN